MNKINIKEWRRYRGSTPKEYKEITGYDIHFYIKSGIYPIPQVVVCEYYDHNIDLCADHQDRNCIPEKTIKLVKL